jgi:hypothetical protein
VRGESSSSAGEVPLSPPARPRARLSRTLTPARWREYRALLEGALENDYSVVGVEDWVAGRASEPEGPLLVLRHDVDQHPRSALSIARVERRLGLRSAWYFRWRTADPGVIASLREDGCTVGLHYETLSRLALEERAGTAEEIAALTPAALDTLREEILAFARLHGPIRSVCPHGDSRIPLARNSSLLKGRDATEFGVEFDVNEAMSGRGLACWLTDRSRAEGGWVGRAEPRELFAARRTPILCVVHPNNWSSGPSLWLDRLLAAALPKSGGGGPRLGPLRTGLDAPPA